MSRSATQPARASGEFAIGGNLPVVAALDALLKWVDLKETLTEAPRIELRQAHSPLERGAVKNGVEL